MLRRTSNRVKDQVDKMRLTVVVRLFDVASRHCRCRITTLKLCDLSFEENRDFVGEKGRKIFAERVKGRKLCRSAGRSPRVVRRSAHGQIIGKFLE
jgi:hypothetical protein